MVTTYVVKLSRWMGGAVVSFEADPETSEACQAVKLWQLLSEEARPQASRDEWEAMGRAAEWEDLPDDSPAVLLTAAEKAGFIDGWYDE